MVTDTMTSKDTDSLIGHYMDARGYSITEVAEIFGLRRRTIAFYIDNGFIRPDILDSAGRGMKRLLSAKNVMEIALLLKLNRIGVRIEYVKDILASLHAGCKPASAFNDEENEHIRSFWDVDFVGNLPTFLVIYNPDAEDIKAEHISIAFKGPGNRICLLPDEIFDSVLLLNVTQVKEKLRVAMRRV
jgi:DNA-binding transcriptional MerR regulator